METPAKLFFPEFADNIDAGGPAVKWNTFSQVLSAIVSLERTKVYFCFDRFIFSCYFQFIRLWWTSWKTK